MLVTLSRIAGDAMLDVLGGLLDGGSIELMSEGDRVLAVLRLGNPATQNAAAGTLEFNPIAEEDAALAQGTAMTAHVLAADGSKLFSCDVGDESSDAVIRLNTTRIYRGGPVRLRSFRLAMPSEE